MGWVGGGGVISLDQEEHRVHDPPWWTKGVPDERGQPCSVRYRAPFPTNSAPRAGY